MKFRLLPMALSAGILAALSGCATYGDASGPVPRVSNVEITRYMGPWHIIAAIPLSLEVGAYNPVETYSLNPDGSIATVFQFRQDSYTGTLETKPTLAHIESTGGDAEWHVKLIWPLYGQYVISYLESDYSAAIVARDKRDHVWILSRSATIPAGKLEAYKAKIAAMGYDVNKLVIFPQNGALPWK